MAKKMTIVEQYGAIVAKCKDILTADEIAFLEGRAELVAKKNATRKPTKAQAENEDIKAKILEVMESGVSYTVTDIMKMVGLESNQKTSALVRQLKEADLVVRTESKGKAYFTKAQSMGDKVPLDKTPKVCYNNKGVRKWTNKLNS